MKETTERMIYRMKCRNRGFSGMCYKKSGWSGGVHLNIACTSDTDCPRMKRYDKLNRQ